MNVWLYRDAVFKFIIYKKRSPKSQHPFRNNYSYLYIFLPLIFALSTMFLIFIHHTDINRKYYPFFFQLHSFACIFQHHLLKLHFDRAYKIWPLVSSEQIKCWQLHFFFFSSCTALDLLMFSLPYLHRKLSPGPYFYRY